MTGVRPEIVAEFAQDPATAKDEGVSVVRRFLALARRVNPFCGGPDQIIAIDYGGGRWIEHPPVGTIAAEMAHAVITASISITSPILTGTTSVSGGTLEARPLGGGFPFVQISSSSIRCYSNGGAPTIQLDPNFALQLSVPIYMDGFAGYTGAIPASATLTVKGGVITGWS